MARSARAGVDKPCVRTLGCCHPRSSDPEAPRTRRMKVDATAKPTAANTFLAGSALRRGAGSEDEACHDLRNCPRCS